MSQKSGEFEFKLGRSGLAFFTFVIALVLLFAFVCGVMVGKNIESYPEKIARGIPEVIRETIAKSMDIEPDTTGSDTKPPATQDDVTPNPGTEEEKVEFTFYDRLKEPVENVKETFTAEEISSPDISSVPPENKQPGDPYTIQIASFKDRDMAEPLCEKVSQMGYTPRVDEVDLQSGTWFRVRLGGFATYDEAKTVASLLEGKIRGIKCLIIKNREPR